MNQGHRADTFAGMFAPAVVDIFAGCGGWSIGAERAFVGDGYRDRYIDLMVNHWSVAVGVHQANHPMTSHLRANILEVDPDAVLPGRRIAYLHASPDCTDHSKAKGGKPRSTGRRALADVVITWADRRRPDVITLENVEEFARWGPLLPNGQPDKRRRGEEFRRWVGELEAMGYEVEWRELRACDYGAPTSRKRLYVIARCDGRPIVWPAASHGRRVSKLKPYRTAAECIDWSQPMLSIFATRDEAREWARELNRIRAKDDRLGVPQRTLKPKTQARIAEGLLRWVLGAAKPFIITIADYGWGSSMVGRPVTESLSTVTAGPKGGKHAVCDVTVSVFTVPRYGERAGQSPRSRPIEEPMPTVVGTGNGAQLVAVALSKHYTGVVGQPAGHTIGTVTAVDHHSVLAAYLARCAHGHGQCHSLADPTPTITGHDRFGLVGVETNPILLLRLTAKVLRRARTVALWARRQLGVRVKPHLVRVRDDHGRRFSLLGVGVRGELHVVRDIAMRMLRPRELARAQGFDDAYIIDRMADGSPVTKADQVKLIGNSVCPDVAEAIVRVNVVDQGVLDEQCVEVAGGAA